MRNRERERRAQRKRREQEIRLQMFVLAVGAALLLFLVIFGIGRWREAVAERKRLEAERKRLEAERALQEREEELLSDSVLEYEDLVKYKIMQFWVLHLLKKSGSSYSSRQVIQLSRYKLPTTRQRVWIPVFCPVVLRASSRS